MGIIIAEPVGIELQANGTYAETTTARIRTGFTGPTLDTRGQELVEGVNTAREAVYSVNSAWRYVANTTYKAFNDREAAGLALFMERLRGAVNSCQVILPLRFAPPTNPAPPDEVTIALKAGTTATYTLAWTSGAWAPKAGDWINLNRRLVRIDTATMVSATAYDVTFIQAVHLVATTANTPGFTGRTGNLVEVKAPYLIARGSGNPIVQTGANQFLPITMEWVERLL